MLEIRMHASVPKFGSYSPMKRFVSSLTVIAETRT